MRPHHAKTNRPLRIPTMTVPHWLPDGYRGMLAIILALSLSGCIDTQATDDLSTVATSDSALCTDSCRIVVEGDATRSYESSVARNPLDPDNILIGAASLSPDGIGEACEAVVAVAGNCPYLSPGEPLWNHVSFDGGETWASDRFPGDVPPEHPLFAPGVIWADPNVAFLADGTALFIGMYGNDGVMFDIFLARSHDGGLTWPEATIIAKAPAKVSGLPPNMEGSVMDQPFLAVGPDDTLLATWAWYHDDGSERQDLTTAVSHDGGVTWSDPVHLTDDCICRNARPVIADDGMMYMMYLDKSQIRWHGAAYEAAVYMARSDDGGAVWETWRLPDIHGSYAGDLAIHDGILYISLSDMDDEGRHTVHLMRSEDGGVTWSDRVLGRSEGAGPAIPMLDISPDGYVFVLHYETAADGRPSVVATRLGPDGIVASQTVTNGPLGAHDYSLIADDWPVYGDYSGVFADEHGAIATWVGGGPNNTDLLLSLLDLPTSCPGSSSGPGMDRASGRAPIEVPAC